MRAKDIYVYQNKLMEFNPVSLSLYSYKQVLKMAGFDLCVERSGKTSQSVTPDISKQGKADLRYALYQAASMCPSVTETLWRITPISSRADRENTRAFTKLENVNRR